MASRSIVPGHFPIHPLDTWDAMSRPIYADIGTETSVPDIHTLHTIYGKQVVGMLDSYLMATNRPALEIPEMVAVTENIVRPHVDDSRIFAGNRPINLRVLIPSLPGSDGRRIAARENEHDVLTHMTFGLWRKNPDGTFFRAKSHLWLTDGSIATREEPFLKGAGVTQSPATVICTMEDLDRYFSNASRQASHAQRLAKLLLTPETARTAA